MVNHSSASSALEFIFSNLGATPEVIAEKKSKNLSILDFIKDDYAELLNSKKLGLDDKTRLSRHFSLVRDLEKRVENQNLSVCGNPDLSRLTGGSVQSPEHLRDLFFVAETLIKCNLTKVITISPDSSHLHDITHSNDGNNTTPEATQTHFDLIKPVAQEFMTFLNNIDAPELGGDTFLDRSLVSVSYTHLTLPTICSV